MSLPEALVSGLEGRYRIEGLIGSGGMASVYLADDLRHHRKVAIKVLRPELVAIVGGDRFLKEIEVTANLHHPHILGLIDSGTANGQLYYVMPFMRGESLRGRLDREKQLPVDDTIEITAAVAGALDYAHRQGVIHRDIKPENILLHDGQAMVADFGIALALSQAVGTRLTETGLSVGTPQYMSPEQASGEGHIDGRTDIYSLGATAYEMLAGRPPFTGPTAQAILSALITTDPPPVTRTRPNVPEHLAAAVHTALERIPADRFQSAGELAEAMRRPTLRTSARIRTTQKKPGHPLAISAIVGVTALALGLLIGRQLAAPPATTGSLTRHWNLMLPTRAPLALTGPGPLGIWQLAIAVAPAGDRLAYTSLQGGATMLAVRPLSRDSAFALPGTEGAYYPFFSPDGRWIGYFSGNQLRKVPTSGGAPVTLTTVERPAGAVWRTDDEILLFEQDGFQMRRIAADGSRDSSIVLSSQFGAPELLPGGEWAVGHLSSGQLALLSLRDTAMFAITRRGVIPLDSVKLEDLLLGASPKYVSSGHLVFGSGDGVLMALPFDVKKREIRGGPVAVVSGIRIEEGFGFAQYATTPDGTLIFVPGQSQLYGRLALLRADGGYDTLPLPRGQYTQPRLSPDGKRLAVHATKGIGGWEILIVDLETGVPQRIEVAGNYRAYPAAWGPDGQSIMVGLFRPVQNVFLGARMYDFRQNSWEEMLRFDGSYMTIAPNGREFVYSNWRTGDLFVRPLRGDTMSTAIPARGWAASFAPDGKFLAWGGADGGVAVSPLPPTGAIYPVAERGQQPLWTPDGKRLIYRDGRRFMQVHVDASGGTFRSTRPALLAEGPFIRTFAWNHTMTPGGQIVALISTAGDNTRELRVITRFDEELKQRVPTAKP
ncbi:MAG TPA: protein kinase [Gemmatimonadales bacterium]|nr:protein kinase [Gemmatimonadales bacterium]